MRCSRDGRFDFKKLKLKNIISPFEQSLKVYRVKPFQENPDDMIKMMLTMKEKLKLSKRSVK
jgi:hypothetical protein